MRAIILTILALMLIACSPAMATGAIGTQSMTSTATVAFVFTIMAICYISLTLLFHVLARIAGVRKP